MKYTNYFGKKLYNGQQRNNVDRRNLIFPEINSISSTGGTVEIHQLTARLKNVNSRFISNIKIQQSGTNDIHRGMRVERNINQSIKYIYIISNKRKFCLLYTEKQFGLRINIYRNFLSLYTIKYGVNQCVLERGNAKLILVNVIY